MFFGSQWFHVTFSHSNGRFFAYFRVCHLLLCVIVAITTAFPCQLFARIRRIEVEEKHAPQHQNISPLVDCTYSYSPTTPSFPRKTRVEKDGNSWRAPLQFCFPAAIARGFPTAPRDVCQCDELIPLSTHAATQKRRGNSPLQISSIQSL